MGATAPSLLPTRASSEDETVEHNGGDHDAANSPDLEIPNDENHLGSGKEIHPEDMGTQPADLHARDATWNETLLEKPSLRREVSSDGHTHVVFTDEVKPPPPKSRALYIPPPHERDRGHPLVEVEEESDNESVQNVARARATDADYATPSLIRQRTVGTTRTLERVASSLFVVGGPPSQIRRPKRKPVIALSKDLGLPYLSSQATVGRNSLFQNLTAKDREKIGGIEYRSLKLLLKVLLSYFFTLHVFGAVCLVAWILHADPKYHQVLAEEGQNKVWWSVSSAQLFYNPSHQCI
ncbi:Potassium uptake transporter [Aspergillus sclerotialis]|uniref:Potassium uptake transporter n=1 Tax=Aspergillus sclerotialis TaxID=2070753 RepID=A0A3A3A1G5_9EURO|nr:Potassium uptake transporter [Aspergillus sclerotialis]